MPPGMFDTLDKSLRRMSRLRIVTASAVAVCGSTTNTWSSSRTTRPLVDSPDFISISLAAKPSAMAVEGRTADSSRSCKESRFPTPVRSGPTLPPSPANRWHWTQPVCLKAALPDSKERPAPTLSSDGSRSSSFQSRTNWCSGFRPPIQSRKRARACLSTVEITTGGIWPRPRRDNRW